ncbi:retrovirus-related Pol polyprotein from transposon 412 [Trichonephila clavipes]|nr:retrovirus-related Pol polyprotein from transposon 412 [Trichonephila clavipes]
MDGSQISCAALRALALNSREQLIREQREDPELGHIYRYLENADDGSVNATVCEGWSQDFKLNDGLLFYANYSTTLGELRVYISQSLREAIMQEFHDLPLEGHLGKRKTYLKLRDTCYFPYMRKYIFEYVSICDRCQNYNYKDALPAGRLIPIVSNYPNEIVTLDLLGPYPASRPERYRFILVITDHFTKWRELIPLRKASTQAIANALFENYISRYGTPISLISDNGPQFISHVFEHLSHRLDIKHIKTVTYRPQANLRERVNRTLVQLIACFVAENHDNWDNFSMNSLSRYPQEGSSNGWSRSHPGKSRCSRKPTGDESKSRKSNKGTAGLEDLRLKRKVRSNGTAERNDRKRSKICRKRSFQGSEHGDQKRPTPVLPQGIKRTVLSSVASRDHKYRRNNLNPSQGSESAAGPSHQQKMRQLNPPKEESRRGTRVYRLKEPEGIPEEQWDRQYTAEQPQEKEPQHGSFRRRSGG